MAEIDKITLRFIQKRHTKTAVLFDEQEGGHIWSDQGVAVGPLYIKKQTLELIGNPNKITVTIEPA